MAGMTSTDIIVGGAYFALAVVIGAWSERKGGSFAAGFFASMLLTPLVAGPIVAMRKPIKNRGG
jgi:hypothetical protein